MMPILIWSLPAACAIRSATRFAVKAAPATTAEVFKKSRREDVVGSLISFSLLKGNPTLRFQISNSRSQIRTSFLRRQVLHFLPDFPAALEDIQHRFIIYIPELVLLFLG